MKLKFYVSAWDTWKRVNGNDDHAAIDEWLDSSIVDTQVDDH